MQPPGLREGKAGTWEGQSWGHRERPGVPAAEGGGDRQCLGRGPPGASVGTAQAPLSSGLCFSAPQATHRAVLTLDDDAFSERMYFDVGPWPSLPIFKFNRPFLVIVKDDNNNFPVFVGKVVNPSQG